MGGRGGKAVGHGQAGAPAGAVDLGPLPELTGYMLRRAQLAVFQDFLDSFAALDLRPAEFSVLLVLERNPGVRQGLVADALGIAPPNFAMLLRRLVARGLAEQRAHPVSRRALALHLTGPGAALLRRAMAALDRHERRVTARLGDGAEGEARRRHLVELLRAVAG